MNKAFCWWGSLCYALLSTMSSSFLSQWLNLFLAHVRNSSATPSWSCCVYIRGQFSGKPRDVCVLPLLCSIWPKHGHQIHDCRCFELRETDCIHCCIMDCFTWKKGTICSLQCMTQHENAELNCSLGSSMRAEAMLFCVCASDIVEGRSKQSYLLIGGLNTTQNEKKTQIFSCKLFFPPPDTIM